MQIFLCSISGIPNNNTAFINKYMAFRQLISLNKEIIYINQFHL